MNAAIKRRVKIVSLDNPDEVDLLRQQIPESFYTSVVKRLLSKEQEYDLRKVVDALNAGDMESLYRFGVGDMAIPEIAAFAKLMIEQRNLLNVKSTVHQITITIIDGKLNTASRLEREAEAQKIASRIESIISSKSEFSQIAIIHVDYVKSNGRKSKPVQGIDFNKSPAGSFPIHRT